MAAQMSAWERNYRQRQELINGWAREYYCPRLRQVDKILIRHPSEPNPDPCERCAARFFCGKPCEAKQRWEKGEALGGMR